MPVLVQLVGASDRDARVVDGAAFVGDFHAVVDVFVQDGLDPVFGTNGGAFAHEFFARRESGHQQCGKSQNE